MEQSAASLRLVLVQTQGCLDVKSIRTLVPLVPTDIWYLLKIVMTSYPEVRIPIPLYTAFQPTRPYSYYPRKNLGYLYHPTLHSNPRDLIHITLERASGTYTTLHCIPTQETLFILPPKEPRVHIPPYTAFQPRRPYSYYPRKNLVYLYHPTLHSNPRDLIHTTLERTSGETDPFSAE
jgi:hypothetical protein